MGAEQQLAFVSSDELRSCQASAQRLVEIVSFDNDPSEYLELDWSHLGWEQAALASGLPATAALLVRACDGDAEVNPAYREYPGTVFEHPVSFLTASATAEVAAALQHVDSSFLSPRALAMHRELIPRLAEFVPTADPSALMLASLEALRSFYMSASGEGMAMLLWWD